MKIREMRQADFKKGLLDCLNTLAPTKFTVPTMVGAIFRGRKERKVKTFVAVEAEQGRQIVVGTYSVFVEPKFIHGGSYVGHVEDVAVHPDWQGRGVGQAMMAHAVAFCRAKRCYKVVLYCAPDLIPFYQNVGFYHNGAELRLDINPNEEKD